MTFTFGAGGRLIMSAAIRYNHVRGRAMGQGNDSDGEFGGIRVPIAGGARWEYDPVRTHTYDGASPRSTRPSQWIRAVDVTRSCRAPRI